MPSISRLVPADLIREAAHPLAGSSGSFDPLLEWIGDASVVLLGEASHGTHEFYKARAEITKRLIAERGFTAVAVDADWPDAYRVNRFVRGAGTGREAVDALASFQRFPAWMWRNADILDFTGWLRTHNENLSASAQTGFYGLDLYSLRASIETMLRHLDHQAPEAASRARDRLAAFENFSSPEETFGLAAGFDLSEECEEEIIRQLVELRRQSGRSRYQHGPAGEDDYFSSVENTRLLPNAENYYRRMFKERHLAWNLRDRHMAETLDSLIEHLRQWQSPKVVVWAHNCHLGDARATEMGEAGELNLGQLVRERHAADAFLIGFTTYSGTVTAASAWGGPAERKTMLPALPGSVETLFHQSGHPNFMLNLKTDDESTEILRETLLERAIGILYHPDNERENHYFHARLSDQFDAVIHFDETRAVEPLERAPR